MRLKIFLRNTCLLIVVLVWNSLGGFSQTTQDVFFKSSDFSYGISGGISHYIGDLNPNFDAFVPGWSASIYLKKYYNNYVALRYQFTAANFGYSDKYATNLVRKNRNLDFQTNIFEVAAQGDFHFFYYSSGSLKNNFTPYITLGLGLFYFDPYTYYNQQKIYLRPLKTEGSAYFPLNVSVPVGIGVKWSWNKYLSWGIELNHRFCFTDYLDDVSTNYPINLSNDPATNALSNRSLGLLNTSQNLEGKQRGQSTAFDMFFSLQFHVSINVFKYYCP